MITAHHVVMLSDMRGFCCGIRFHNRLIKPYLTVVKTKNKMLENISVAYCYVLCVFCWHCDSILILLFIPVFYSSHFNYKRCHRHLLLTNFFVETLSVYKNYLFRWLQYSYYFNRYLCYNQTNDSNYTITPSLLWERLIKRLDYNI